MVNRHGLRIFVQFSATII